MQSLVGLRDPPMPEARPRLWQTGGMRRPFAQVDVFTTEPLPKESPLWTIENVIITPHHAGSSPRVRERTLALFAENLRRYKAGEPLINRVDFEVGY